MLLLLLLLLLLVGLLELGLGLLGLGLVLLLVQGLLGLLGDLLRVGVLGQLLQPLGCAGLLQRSVRATDVGGAAAAATAAATAEAHHPERIQLHHQLGSRGALGSCGRAPAVDD